jgi:hypothetical protein
MDREREREIERERVYPPSPYDMKITFEHILFMENRFYHGSNKLLRNHKLAISIFLLRMGYHTHPP